MMALGLVAAALGAVAPGWAQGSPGRFRIALLPEWAIRQHRGVGGR